jgi:hypothetical protein
MKIENDDLRPYLISFAFNQGLYSYQLDRIVSAVDNFLRQKTDMEDAINKLLKTEEI